MKCRFSIQAKKGLGYLLLFCHVIIACTAGKLRYHLCSLVVLGQFMLCLVDDLCSHVTPRLKCMCISVC